VPVRRQWDADVVVVGAGIVGLAHALEAVRRGLSVTVVERDERALGASVRNFGHCFVTAQAGESLELALESRARWLELGADAGFAVRECGTVLVARRAEELAVVHEFVESRSHVAEVLTAGEVRARVPVAADRLLGGLWTPLDCRLDAREALPAIARWLEQENDVTFLWRTAAHGADTGTVWTSRGDVRAEAIVLAAGHDLDRLVPDAELDRCTLQMLRVSAPDGRTIEPALMTGLSLLRYRAFARCPSAPALQARLAEERPELLEAGVNLIVAQRPDGDLVVGDTHTYAVDASPFRSEAFDRLVLDEAAALLGSGPLAVRERWLGVYAHARDRELLVTSPAPGVRGVAVTAGIGMTIGLGLGARVLDELHGRRPVTI
jgi:FAD dependent oxidoreductase TIGR03364